MSTMNKLALLALATAVPSASAWPIKTIDLSEDGALCDTSTEQYLQVEAYDYHDHPKVTMTWSQVTGPCGAEIADADKLTWTTTYDSIDDTDDKPDDDGRVQLNLFVCCPFGDYELKLEVDSYSEAGSTLEQRTAWEIENGPDEYHIWDTVNTYLADDEAYSPTVPGTYTWPLEGETGYYATMFAGPLPPLDCDDDTPAGDAYEGCYYDTSKDRTFTQDSLVLEEMGTDGMTNEVCSDFCADYPYFGTEYGSECFCGSQEEFDAAVTSEDCGLTFQAFCTGDATETCGGSNAMSVYSRTTPTPSPTPAVDAPYVSEGCYVDSKTSRIMSEQYVADPMSAEICFGLCNDGVNNYFGTEFTKECFCGVDSDLTKNGAVVADSECSSICSGSTTDETCGARDRMNAYSMTDPEPEFLGCFADAKSNRALPDNGRYLQQTTMTNELCIAYCGNLGYTYAGTQYGVECWCSGSSDYDKNGDSTSCTYPCAGDADDVCGGYYAVSVYSV